MPYKVGLTGGIGSGKSTVADAFANLGIATFSADVISHALSQKGRVAYQNIVEVFGTGILKPDGELDRKALGDIIFSDERQKSQLESILHPLIMQALHQQADAASTEYCVLDIPLLINTAERERVDRILVVQCEQQERIARIQKRNGWSLQKINRVINSQVSEQALIAAADDIIDNSGDVAAIRAQVARLHQEYLVFASH
jgi:dephospho-CoA kinase